MRLTAIKRQADRLAFLEADRLRSYSLETPSAGCPSRSFSSMLKEPCP